MKIAGYRAHMAPGEYSGEPGTVYNYIMAGNGLFIESESEYLQARIQIAQATVRGLADLQERVVLTHGHRRRFLVKRCAAWSCVSARNSTSPSFAGPALTR